MAAKTLVAVTDRRIITANTNAFLEQGEIRQDIPIDRVRYVRAATTQDRSGRLAIDLIECAGSWPGTLRTASHRVVVRAALARAT